VKNKKLFPPEKNFSTEPLLLILGGYEDANDCDSMRHDPLLELAVGREADGAPLASQPSFRWLNQAPLNIEASDQADGAELVKWLNTCVRYGHSGWEDFLLSSSDLAFLSDLRRRRSELRTGLIVGGGDTEELDLRSVETTVRRCGANCVVLSLPSLRSLAIGLAARRHNPELRIVMKLINRPGDLRSALAWGADGVISDDPARIRVAMGLAERREK